MRRLLIATAAALAIAVSPATALAAPKDTTTGTGARTVDPLSPTRQEVHVNAASDDGQDPRGHFFLQFEEVGFAPTAVMQGDVTCHEVSGSTATVGGVLRNPPPGFQPNWLIFINDDGEPGAGQDDLALVGEAAPPTVCPPFEFEAPIEKGNYSVHDR